MSSQTNYLNLFIYDVDTDKKQYFSIKNALTENFKKIDNFAKNSNSLFWKEIQESDFIKNGDYYECILDDAPIIVDIFSDDSGNKKRVFNYEIDITSTTTKITMMEAAKVYALVLKPTDASLSDN